jgi:hypothetical protein
LGLDELSQNDVRESGGVVAECTADPLEVGPDLAAHVDVLGNELVECSAVSTGTAAAAGRSGRRGSFAAIGRRRLRIAVERS